MCKKPLLQPKSENAPDFSAWVVYTWVECKEVTKKGYWNWKEIYDGERKNQREFLEKNGGWLFILLGTGRVSKVRENSGRAAYLVPFHAWKLQVEPVLLDNNMSSIKFEAMRGDKPAGDELLGEWRLDWGGSDEGWIIPNGHMWWRSLKSILRSMLFDIEEHL